MKKIFKRCASKSIMVLAFYAFTIGDATAQEQVPRNALQLTGGLAKHGSGDMKGLGMGAEYVRYGSKNRFLNYSLRTTINNEKHEIIVNNVTAGTSQDASIRFTTAGVQLGVDGGLALLRNKLFTGSVSLGAFLRYQAASNGTDGYSLYGPAATGLPLVLVEYSNKTPQETIALGGLLQLQLDINLSRQLYIGLVPRFQTDTNGDAILFFGLAVGRRF